jgi:hypothetical protein
MGPHGSVFFRFVIMVLSDTTASVHFFGRITAHPLEGMEIYHSCNG